MSNSRLLSYYSKRILAAGMSLIPGMQPTRFVIFSRGRTGSNLLLSLLRSHPQIRAQGEVIGETMMRDDDTKREIVGRGPLNYVKRRFRRLGLESAVGIKVLYYQVEPEYEEKWGVDGLQEVMDFLKADKDIKVIHLMRRNKLETHCSRTVAIKTKQFLLEEGEKDKGKITVHMSPEECAEEFRLCAAWEDAIERDFADHDLLSMHYEDLVAEREQHVAKTLDFLGVEQRDLKTKLRKQRKAPISETIENYAELKATFSGTQWESYFTE